MIKATKLILITIMSFLIISCNDKASFVYTDVSPSILEIVAKEIKSDNDYVLMGTGWAALWKGGPIYVTAKHVVDNVKDQNGNDMYEFAIKYNDKIYPVKCNLSEKYDVAILTPNTLLPKIPLLEMADRNPSVGSDLYVIGNPRPANEQYINVIEVGIVNQYIPIVFTEINGTISGATMGISSRVAPGNSGGPVLDSTSKVIGLVSNGYRTYNQFQFAVPIETIIDEITAIQLEKKQKFLGLLIS